jgi:hypothetical protein
MTPIPDRIEKYFDLIDVTATLAGVLLPLAVRYNVFS